MTTIEERIVDIRRSITDLKCMCYAEASERPWDEDEAAYWEAIIGELSDAEDSMRAAYTMI